MSEARTDSRPSIAGPVDLVGTHAACALCTHVHRVTRRHEDLSLDVDEACECGCTANGDIYDHGYGSFDVDTVDFFTRIAAGRDRERRHLDGDHRLGLHQASRERGPVQRPDSTQRGVRDRIQPERPHLAEPWVLGRAMGSAGGGAGPGRADAVWKVRLAAVVERLCVWFGVSE